MTKKKEVPQKRIVDREVRVSNDWHFTLDDFIKEAESESKSVLPEFKDTIKFKVENYSEPYCENNYAGLFMIYKDYETDEEFAKRLELEDYHNKIMEAREKAEFKRLSKKFSGVK